MISWISCILSGDEYLAYILCLCTIYLLLSQSLNIILGGAGLFSLSHVVHFAIGSYATAIFSTRYELQILLLLPLSAAMASISALFVAIMSLRLREEYFAIGTVTFAFIVLAVVSNWTSLTGGVLGIPGIPDPSLLGWNAGSYISLLIVNLTVSLPILLFLWYLWKTPFVRVLRAASEFENGVQSIGYNVSALRISAVVLSAAVAGVAGCLFAFLLKFIDPSSFSLNEMVLVLSMVILGRPGSFLGVSISTIVLIFLPEALRCVPILQEFASSLGQIRQLIYASLLFLFVFLLRNKLFRLARRV